MLRSLVQRMLQKKCKCVTMTLTADDDIWPYCIDDRPEKYCQIKKTLQLASLLLFLSPSLAYFSFHILLLFDFLGVHTYTLRPSGMKVCFCFHSSRLPPPRARSSSSSERRVLRFFRVHWPHNARTHIHEPATLHKPPTVKGRKNGGKKSEQRGCDENT